MKTPTELIRQEIEVSGVISFARFMELALYAPATGYYEWQRENVGRRGDFITSVSTGSLFGELLAFQFAAWLKELPVAKAKRQIVEAGAHDGKLAADILHWLQRHRPELFAEIEYVILEPSPHRQSWQAETLKNFAPCVRWFSGFDAAAVAPFTGVIFSNELLDAFPVHRFGWDTAAKTWFEWGVALAGEKFVWTKLANSEFGIRNLELEAVLPDGYIVEVSPVAENWWRTAAGFLANGKLLALDYGLAADELFSPARRCGTLRAYHHHRVSDDLLANAGEQDLTAHVNISAMQKAGEAAGLRTENFLTQPQFLTQILAAAVKDKSFTGFDAKQVRQFQTLTHPEHLGRAFRVLVQAR